MGFHNDCFLVPNPDGGSFFGDAANARMLRDAICAATSRGFFSGENCNIHLLEVHNPVTPSLSDGAPFQLSALNFVTKKASHDGWKTQGSFAKVSRKVGYELRLAELKIGSKGRVELKVANDCWARPAHARAIVLKAYRKGKLRGEVR